MSSSVPNPNPGPPPGGPPPGPDDAVASPPSPDGRPQRLAELRAELDSIDDRIHDLLIARALVVEEVGKSGKPSAFRPGREASIVRRLTGRHTGKLPAQALFRIWRELLAGTTGMQTPLQIAVCDAAPGASMTQIAREHFGALTPIRVHRSASGALTEVGNQTASVAVLPVPTEADGWWTTLSRQQPRMHVIARLPFWSTRTEGAPSAQALVVATSAPDPSGHDRSLLLMELDADVSRQRLTAELTAAGLVPATMVLHRSPGSPVAAVLVEVDGYVADDDKRLASVPRRPVVLGGYAVPMGDNA